MNDLPTILLTGFTGVLGKRLAYKLASKGHRVFCLIRSGSEAEARDHFFSAFHGLKELLPEFDESIESRLQPIPGDIREKGLGLPPSILQDLKGPQTKEIWHLASLYDLTEGKSRDVYDTNLVGTLHVLEFAKQQGIPELYYFSTYASSGNFRDEIVREIPGVEPPLFRNTYEHTQWEAERHIWQAQIQGKILSTIYRPSMVVGDSILGRYENFNVLNHLLDVLSQTRKKICIEQGLDPQLPVLKYNLRIPGDENATLNLVPLDFVMNTVLNIYSIPRSQGRVYHIVNPHPPSLRSIIEIFNKYEPWEGLRWEKCQSANDFQNPFEKFAAKKLEFLIPYLMGEALYDCSNAQMILAFHGGLPVLKNEPFLGAIFKRGIRYGWQENKNPHSQNTLLDSPKFVWPEKSEYAVDFLNYHPVGNLKATGSSYSLTERFLGKTYQVLGKFFLKRNRKSTLTKASVRDIVIVPFGMGVTRRGEAEQLCYKHHETLANQVFACMNQVIGFDLRAYARQNIPYHLEYGNIHDHCCWAVADTLIHLMLLFRDIQMTGGTNLISRMQILPHSGGLYTSAWLTGMVSFQDMAFMVHQSSHFPSENERLISLKEVDSWFNSQSLSKNEQDILKQLCQKINLNPEFNRIQLAEKLCGRLDLVYSINANSFQKLIEDIEKNKINVTQVIPTASNIGVFGGNALEMFRFRNLFVGKRMLELKRMPLEVSGTPHYRRLQEASYHNIELLNLYEQQGRLIDPMIPFLSYDGQWIRTRKQFIRAVAGLHDQTYCFDQMIERILENGGQHFFLIQSGLSAAAGNLMEGIIRHQANHHGHTVQIYPPKPRLNTSHPICKLLIQQQEKIVLNAMNQTLTETIQWYEEQLSSSK